MQNYLFILITLLLLTSCTQNDDAMIKEVQLTTSDNFKLFADFYESSKENSPVVILLHQMNHDKSSWKSFAGLLQKNGYAVLALDSRGHGKSQGKWKDFSDKDFLLMVNDVQAGYEFLKSQKKVNITNFAVIGASIGANTALSYEVKTGNTKTIILLSPGLDYRGVKTDDAIKKLKKPVLFITSKEDSYSAETVQKLNDLASGIEREVDLYNNVGHGTYMFAAPELKNKLLTWLDKYLK